VHWTDGRIHVGTWHGDTSACRTYVGDVAIIV